MYNTYNYTIIELSTLRGRSPKDLFFEIITRMTYMQIARRRAYSHLPVRLAEGTKGSQPSLEKKMQGNFEGWGGVVLVVLVVRMGPRI